MLLILFHLYHIILFAVVGLCDECVSLQTDLSPMTTVCHIKILTSHTPCTTEISHTLIQKKTLSQDLRFKSFIVIIQGSTTNLCAKELSNYPTTETFFPMYKDFKKKEKRNKEILPV